MRNPGFGACGAKLPTTDLGILAEPRPAARSPQGPNGAGAAPGIGCNLQPGDLLGSGAVSGPAKDSRGCLLELTWRGAEPLKLPDGEERGFLADGDEVILRGHAERPGFRRIGLGECRGVVRPAA